MLSTTAAASGAGVLHVADKDPCFVVVRPRDPGDLLLPASAEDREDGNRLHRSRRWPLRSDATKVLHDLVQLIERRAPVPLAALAGDTEFPGDGQRVLHQIPIERIAPRWPGDSEDRAEVTEVVLPRLWLYGDALGERNHVLGSDLGAFQRGDVVLVPDLFEYLLLGAPDPRRFLDVTVDHFPERRVFKGARERAWFPQLRLAPIQPGFRSLLPVEGLSFPVDDLLPLLPHDLCAICGRAALSLPWNYGPHGTPFPSEVRLWCTYTGKMTGNKRKWPGTKQRERAVKPR
jgi:hypothetical protein